MTLFELTSDIVWAVVAGRSVLYAKTGIVGSWDRGNLISIGGSGLSLCVFSGRYILETGECSTSNTDVEICDAILATKCRVAWCISVCLSREQENAVLVEVLAVVFTIECNRIQFLKFTVAGRKCRYVGRIVM